MGQFALGLRSLLFKAAIFVIMAALLAWALGGTLWPQPEVAYPFAEAGWPEYAGRQWLWKLSVGGKKDGEIKWELLFRVHHNDPHVFRDYKWSDVAGAPIVAENALFLGVISFAGHKWQIEKLEVDRQGSANRLVFPMPDRLAVEQQLERLKAGLPLQDMETILRQRQQVLDPIENPADKNETAVER